MHKERVIRNSISLNLDVKKWTNDYILSTNLFLGFNWYLGTK